MTGVRMSDVDLTDVDERHVGLLRTLVRMEIRRNAKKIARLIARFGDEVRDEHLVEKEDLLVELYRMLGGDPDEITNVEPEPEPAEATS